MRAITADIVTHEISAIADVSTFSQLADNLMLITEDQWVADPQPGQVWQGNIPASFCAPYVPVPQEVSMRQARLALLNAGILSSVDGALNALPSPQKEQAQIDWEYSSVVLRDSPLVIQLGAALNLSSQQIDQLFIAAGAIT